MDPNLFHLDWERLSEVLIAIIVLSILLERALAIIFEHRLFVKRLDQKGLKEFIAFLVAFFVCWQWDFDAVSMILLTEKVSFPGELISAGIIAGGSKGSVKLFRDMMGIRSLAYQEIASKKSTSKGSAPDTSGTAGS